MPEPLDVALARLRPLLLDVDQLVRAVAAGRRRGDRPAYARVDLRPVDLKTGRHLQVTTTDGRTPSTRNHPAPVVSPIIDELLGEPFGTWFVQTTDQVVQLRVTKKGEAQVHLAAAGAQRDPDKPEPAAPHDRAPQHLLDPGDPLFALLGADADKRRQVDAFLRLLAPTVDRAAVRAQAEGRPLHVVDLGCGNAYLTFAAHQYLTTRADLTHGVRTIGVELRPELVARNLELAQRHTSNLQFVAGTIDDVQPEFGAPDLVLALHACDTATDDALARAVRWQAPVVLAAPCCHHDVQRQLGQNQTDGVPPPHPYQAFTRHPILRERFADVLTDALRADVLRLLGYRVEVVEFVDSRHTPRNALIRAVRTDVVPGPARLREYRDLADSWHLRPALEARLKAEMPT